MPQRRRNMLFFGLGTVGRDMSYTMVVTYLIVFLTEVMDLPDHTMWWMTLIFTVLRVFDALNDPVMRIIADNAGGRFGKFKPMILLGAVLGALFMVPMFIDFNLPQTAYLLLFAFLYLGWDLSYGANDIAYWSMLPALSVHPKEREKIGAFARICANVGMYAVVVSIIPVTSAIGRILGSARQAWLLFALLMAAMMILFQLFTLIGVKEQREVFRKEEKSGLKDLGRLLMENDQLRWIILSMGLFMVGYSITTGFGVYFFKYAFGNEGMYPLFALIMGITQLSALTVFPLFSRRFSRRQLYFGATVLVGAGYLIFFLSPMDMLPLGIGGFLIFIGQAFIQLLMLMFLADCVEYGQWKLHKRQESLTFSFQPLINKIGGAVASGIVSATLILSGINSAPTAKDVTSGGITLMKANMIILPLICILAGYYFHHRFFKIDEKLHSLILNELMVRGDLKGEAE